MSLPGTFVHALFAEELELWALLDELDDGVWVQTVISLPGTAIHLLFAEESDSVTDDSASRTELLMGSWLRGMSTTTWLELLCFVSVCSWPLCCASVCSALFCCAGVCSELLCRVSVALDDSGVASSFGVVLLGAGWGSSGIEVGVSSMQPPMHAMNVEATVRPSVAASALFAATGSGFASVTFLFSIFILFPSALNFYIRLLEGGDHAHHAWCMG